MTPEQWREWRLRNFSTMAAAARALGMRYHSYKRIEMGIRDPHRATIMAAMALEQFGLEDALAYDGRELRIHQIKVDELWVAKRRRLDRERREKMAPEDQKKRWRPPKLGR